KNMARPKKGNADYFTHDNDMRNNDKIKAVRQKFGLPGYAIWNMFLERMCRAENFTLQINALNLELWSGDFEIDKDKLVEMLQYFLEITLLKTDKEFPLAETVGNSFNGDFNGNLYSENLIKRFAPLLKKRVNDTENYKKREFPPTKTIKKEVSTNRNTQRREREESIKKRKIKEKYLESSTEYRLANLLLTLILKNNPNFKKPNFQDWCAGIRLMLATDNRESSTVEAVISWCQSDSFWLGNILSVNKLRKQFDKLNIQRKINGNGNGKSSGFNADCNAQDFHQDV
ncbi:MAG: Lin1244/Lin1753 domain-containing protein, partial [Candidatus Anammoxibacter sp.]